MTNTQDGCHIAQLCLNACQKTTYKQQIPCIQIHGFGDASGNGVEATAYAVVTQESGITQRLVATKPRIVKKGLTISPVGVGGSSDVICRKSTLG